MLDLNKLVLVSRTASKVGFGVACIEIGGTPPFCLVDLLLD